MNVGTLWGALLVAGVAAFAVGCGSSQARPSSAADADLVSPPSSGSRAFDPAFAPPPESGEMEFTTTARNPSSSSQVAPQAAAMRADLAHKGAKEKVHAARE